MEFKITIILSHIENQSVEDMKLNAQNYIKEFIEDDELIIESIEDITTTRKVILEQQALNRKIKLIKVVKEKCYKCHQQIEYTEEFPFCPNCLASF